MLVDCNKCNSKVDAAVIGSHDAYDSEDGLMYRYSLCKCPVCASPFLGCQYEIQTGPDERIWDSASRLWPEPDNYIDWSIPANSRDSLIEARKCYKATAFSACAVMCGRSIEAICIQYTKEKTLYKGLQALKDAEIIDGRLFEWGDSLRHERNLGAHATGVKTTKDDARDVLEFAIAICEYVYVLSNKYNAYKERKSKSTKAKVPIKKTVKKKSANS